MDIPNRLMDLVSGGPSRRLGRAVSKLEQAFAPGRPSPSSEVASLYAKVLKLALRVQPAEAHRLCNQYDPRLAADDYRRAFPAKDHAWLGRLAASADPHMLQVCLTVSARLELTDTLRKAAGRLADLHADTGASDALIVHLDRCRQLRVADRDFLAAVFQTYLKTHTLADNSAWPPFLTGLPEADLPPLFEVYVALGRGQNAARLATGAAQKQAALACCLRARDPDGLLAGLALAEELADAGALRQLHESLGDVRSDFGDLTTALEHYTKAGCVLKVSQCHERLGRPLEALQTCPPSLQDRLLALVGPCEEAALAHSQAQDYAQAMRALGVVLVALAAVPEPTPDLQTRTVAVGRHRDALLRSARLAFTQQLESLHGEEKRLMYLRWSALEEGAGEKVRAARLAEEAGDYFKASLLWESDEKFGEALRALGRHADRREVLAKMAELAEGGGDHATAAGHYEGCGLLEEASRAYAASGQPAEAARCLRGHLGDEQAAESEEYARLVLQAGLAEDLVRLWLQQTRDRQGRTKAVESLRKAVAGESSLRVRPALLAEAKAALDALQVADRHRFDLYIGNWITQARTEALSRYAPAWGMDLGTSKCAVAIYDLRQRAPVVCPCKGYPQFPSVVALDATGREVVGLSEEELLAPGIRGAIVRSKRKMGSGTVYRIGDRTYRAEEAAARLLAYGRSVVEDFLGLQIRERVRELAQAGLGNVPPKWVEQATTADRLGVSLPQAVVTVPAYFGYKQKQATHDACGIAGLQALRLIHEPTAACLAAGSARPIQGRVVVVDLGAGTLDLSVVELGDGVYEVTEVFGDNDYGSADFDALVAEHLLATLRLQGLTVPPKGLLERRVRLAAEYLKIQLSSADTASYVLRGFGDVSEVTLELRRDEFERLLADKLAKLRAVCQQAAGRNPNYLFLVGAPMLSPLVREQVEQAVGKKATALADPRTAVACGAAVQAAVLTGKAEVVLLDVVPFSLGVRVHSLEAKRGRFNIHVKRGEHIPVSHKEEYSTLEDNQANAHIEVFQGESPDPEKNLLVGHFILGGILPAKAGVPKIDVTFDISASGVLTVTARDRGTGQEKSIQIVDTTMLSPGERADLRTRFEGVRLLERERGEAAALLQGFRDLLARAAGVDAAAAAASWRRRFETYQRSVGAYVTAPADDRALYEMFNHAAEAENQVALAADRLHNLTQALREVLASAELLSPLTASYSRSLQAIRERGGDLEERLRQTLEELNRLNAQFGDWDALLAGLTLKIADADQRFVACHEARAYAMALDAVNELPPAAAEERYLERYLDCLAHRRDRAAYREVLARHAAALGLRNVVRDRLEEFGATALAGLARVQAAWPDGRREDGSGFLVRPGLVATSRRLLVPDFPRGPAVPCGQIELHLAGQRRPVAEVLLSRHAEVDVAVLRLREPADVPPFRLGYVQLVELGEWVFALEVPRSGEAAAEDGLRADGVVNRFRTLPGSDVRVLEVGFTARPGMGGAPLFNDWGEVVGVLTGMPGRQDAEASLALAVEPLRDLIPTPWDETCTS